MKQFVFALCALALLAVPASANHLGGARFAGVRNHVVVHERFVFQQPVTRVVQQQVLLAPQANLQSYADPCMGGAVANAGFAGANLGYAAGFNQFSAAGAYGVGFRGVGLRAGFLGVRHFAFARGGHATAGFRFHR